MFPFSFWKPAGGVFNRASLALSEWFVSPYTASPWLTTASAGTSGAGTASEATIPPTANSGAADFDGTDDELTVSGTAATQLAAGAWSSWVLFWADVASPDNGAGSRYANAPLWSEDGALVGIGFSDAGVSAYQLQVGVGTRSERVVACGTGAWHLAQAKYDGTNLKLRVDSGGWSSVASADVDLTGAAAIKMGFATFCAARYDGRIREMAFAKVAFSDADFDGVLADINADYGLSL